MLNENVMAKAIRATGCEKIENYNENKQRSEKPPSLRLYFPIYSYHNATPPFIWIFYDPYREFSS
jgi:hypothetical protein